MSDRPKLVLIDAHGLVYRAFFALPYFTTRDGRPTNAVYGFSSMLHKVLTEEAPTHVAVAFDRPAPTFRHVQFEEYKAQRERMPDDLRPQVALAKQVVEAFHIPIFEKDGFEAEDVLATIARNAEGKGFDVLIVSGDLDTLQLVGPHTQVMVTSRGITETTVYDDAKVRERFGLPPERIPDLKGLKGDTTDNIPGVPGVGEKTAIRLLQDFGTAGDLVERAGEVREPKLRERIQAHGDQIRQSTHLATIVRDVPIDVDLHDLEWSGPDQERVREVFTTLEFRSLLERMGTPTPAAQEPGRYRETTAAHAARALAETSTVGLSLAVRDGTAISAAVIGVALSTRSGDALFVGCPDGVPAELSAPLERPSPVKVSADAKAELVVLRRAGLDPRGFTFDAGIASYLLNPGKRTHTLDAVAREHLGWTLAAVETGGLGLSTRQPWEDACERADVLLRLHEVLRARLRERDLERLFDEIEMPLVPVLASMETAGIGVDVAYLQELSRELHERLDALTEEIYGLAGTTFNIGSPKQLAFVLFEKLQLPTMKKTKTGYSTDAEVLDTLAASHEVVAKIVEYREHSKLLGTYVDPLPQMVNPQTGRVHTTFNQTVTATGRLSSQDPNLQNIPVRTDVGRKIRRAFVPGPGRVFLGADYSQIELRILAHISQDAGLVEAFASGRDVHTEVAAEVFGVEHSDVTPEMRRKAKIVNFASTYGITDMGLASQLRVPRAEAREIIGRYFERFPAVREYIRATIGDARRTGYVSTLTGRRRYVPDILSRNRQIREAAERTAINMPVQGTNADIIKLAMVRIADQVMRPHPEVQMLLQVHDELLFELPPDLVPAVAPGIRDLMEQAFTLSVPITVELKRGPTWADMDPLEA